MNRKYVLLTGMILLWLNQVIVGQHVIFNNSSVKTINAEHHGFSYVNFYNTCTDAICFNNVVNLKPRVIRFPSAGDADNYFMNFDTAGYGICFAKVAAYLADRYNAASNPLTTPPFTSYTVPAVFDPGQPVLNFNALVPSIFPNILSANSYTAELTDWFNNYRRQQAQIGTSYLTLFKQHIKQIEDSLQPGEKVNVIYVANIFSGTPDDLIKTLTQLTSPSITPVNVVGIELSNESWGKKNNDLFPDPNSGDQFYYYVRGLSGPGSYTGCIATKGDFIYKIKSNFPNIKIGFPTAPLSLNYYGCNLGSSSDTRFNAWNLNHAARNSQSITVTLTSNSTTVSLPMFDAYVAHNYFDEKYWGNDTSETIPACIDCLYNVGNPKKYKNFGAAVASNTASPSFNHGFAYYPMTEDDTLRESFNCQLQESFKFIDSGYVDKLIGLYTSSLSLSNSNNKKLWVTEWNLHPGTNDTTDIFSNTFNQAVLTLGWRMAMYRSNWKFPNANDILQYSTLFNVVLGEQNAALSARTGNSSLGDGPYDSGSSTVRRTAYWASILTRHISLDSLRWIDNQWGNFPNSQNLRLYSFINQTNSYLYLYFVNATDQDQYINVDSLSLSNHVFDTAGIYKEHFYVKNNYSSAGFTEFFYHNKYYRTGPNFTKLFPNDFLNTYSTSVVSGKHQLIKRKSLGVLKLKLHSTTGISSNNLSNDFFTIFPNPSSGILTVKLHESGVKSSVTISDMVGRTIKYFPADKQDKTIDVTDLKDGVYLVTVKTPNSTQCKKIVISKQ